MDPIKKFARFVKPYKWSMVIGIFFILVSLLFGLFVPFLVGMAVDDLSAEITWPKIIYYPLVILGVNAMSGVFLFLQRRILINTSRHIEFDMREAFYASLVGQPLEFFHNNRVGDLMARATNDLAAVRQIVGPMILYSFQAIFALCIVLPILLSISVKLTLLLLIPMPLVSLTVRYLGDQIHKRFEKIQGFFSDITARTQENLSGVRVVRAYAQEDSEIEEFQKLNREYAAQNLRLVKFAAAMRPLLFFFIGLGFVIIVAVGVPMAVRGEITAGNFASFILYLQRMIWYLIALGYVVNLYQRGTASLKRFNLILETEATIKDDEGIGEQPTINGGIEFRDLSFSYNGTPVLSNIDLKIGPGKTVAFVGKTGSGKSTLMSLVPRLIEAPKGSILVDGVPISEFPIEQLRRAIGFVPQETFLFSNTLAANIAFGVDGSPQKSEPEAVATGLLPPGNDGQNGLLETDKSHAAIRAIDLRSSAANTSPSAFPRLRGEMTVEKAAEIAGLADDIKDFPGKYEQLVGERGITLSGVQKQRTAIARAVM
ncbi:MAG: ABC transporter ATP-binding protein, partial [Pyrinomonadaceae bacterium]